MHVLLSAAALFLALTASANPVTLERRATDFKVVALSYSDLPKPLLGNSGISSVPDSHVVRGMDAGVKHYEKGIRLTLKRGSGGTAAVAPRGLNPGEMACSQIFFPDYDYSGVAMTFYTIESDKISNQRGHQDEIDFEFFGSPYRLQINHFQKGKGGHEIMTQQGGKANKLCIVNTGREVRWYVYDNLVSAVPVTLGKQWVWFTIWETKGHPCCGPAKANSWSMDVQEFSVFKLTSPLKPVPYPWPSPNNCAPTRDCPETMTKFGLQTNAGGVSVQLYTADKTFKACNFAPPSTYIEFCLPKLRGGDKVAAYGKDSKEIKLDWAHQPPSGNYYKIKL
ncbi:hypothetical protein HDU96_004271 [Phlyctochytrium bullatum]|nr:hypothetical protein HDU96_004271 [Phlyctochytrium bullatum]